MMERAVAVLLFSLLFLCSSARVPPGPGGSSSSSSNSNGTTDDKLALLSFKSMLLLPGPPAAGSLASWNTSTDHCSWPGVACSRPPARRVVSLLMNSFNLSGRISPFLGNLSFLQELNLGNNQLVGEIPPELGSLRRLQLLNLSANSLTGSIPAAIGGCAELTTLSLTDNRLHGEIPAEIGNLKNLVALFLFSNSFSGEIPRSLAELPSVKHLAFFGNRLSGDIPPSLGNLTNLEFLGLGKNELTGAIPSSLGLLTRLSWLDLGFNNLSGVIPSSIWNISSLVMFSVQQNNLTGTIPASIFDALPHLQSIYMDHNQFHGHIPSSLPNASELSHVQLGVNFFSGILPPDIGRLKNLKWLELQQTLLEAKEPKDWEFMTSLTNCSQLRILDLMFCRFSGALPDSVSNLSTSLEILFLGHNPISGKLPRDIGNLFNLQIIDFYQNSFTGTIPSSLTRLTNLQGLILRENKLSGPIPLAIGNLTELNYLYLGANSFSSRIPDTLGNLSKLLELDLSSNNFVGSIPKGLFNIPTLSAVFDLSYNNLEGSIPQEIGNLNNLVEFHAESNKLSGQIPTTIGECQLLQNLYLQNNLLSGNIPSLLSQLKGLENLDLSSNNLSGQIPKFLGDLRMLSFLNLSFNSFTGEVPTFGVFANASGVSIQGNSKLCGGILDLHLPPCSIGLPKKKHKLLVVAIAIPVVVTLSIFALLYFLLTRRKRSKTKTPSTTIMPGHPSISYSQLVKATDGFSPANLLGSGSFGSVYKGELDDEDGQSANLVAVKVLKLQTPGALKSFTAECEALRNMRHRNLVKIVTACASIDTRGNDFKAIVYDFMPNGSLESWLHANTGEHQTEERYLDLTQRVTILLDVAHALHYLHCDGPAAVIHCDLKPSNVLLDDEMVAHVGDFGLAKIIVEGSSTVVGQSISSMGFRGTTGYAAPEYGAGNEVSTNGDVYSYGVLVLEMVTGKRPTDVTFTEGGLSLRECVELALHNGTMDIIDTRLPLSLTNDEPHQDVGEGNSWQKGSSNCLNALLKLGLSCTEAMPSSRMTTGAVIKELLAIEGSLL